MESTEVKSKILFTLGIGAIAYGVGSSRKITSWNQAGAKWQSATFTISNVAYLVLKERKTLSSFSDKLYYLTSAFLIGGTGFLAKLDWKINALMTTLFALSQYRINQPPPVIPSSHLPIAIGPESPLYIQPIRGNIGACGHLKTNITLVFDNLLKAIGNKSCINHVLLLKELDKHIPIIEDLALGGLPQTKYGRSILYRNEGAPQQSVAVKEKKDDESLEDLQFELRMLQYLEAKKSEGLILQSTLPKSLGIVEGSENPAIAFQTDPKYYDYLSDLQDEKKFEKSLGIAAHDLGYLLVRNLAFPQLLSTLHSERDYTCFPGRIHYQLSEGPEFPGCMSDVTNAKLYENIGLLGLRDFADAVFINEWKSSKPAAFDFRKIPKLSTEAEKVMHFLSLYLLVFGILIGKRAQNFEKEEPLIWNRSADLFVYSYKKLIEGLGIRLDINIQINDTLFNRQMKFGFTKNRKSYDLEGYIHATENVLLTKPTSGQILKLFGSGIKWKEERALYRDYSGYSKENGFGKNGVLGAPSGPLPLVELMRFNYQFVACALNHLYLETPIS